MKLFAGCLSAAGACVEVHAMSCIRAHFVSMTATAASATARTHACALNNNANNNTRIDGWAGV
ncbi:hypothetical protein [Dyella humicola]|uniref:hypothetical protein n=1 Tax=Dyella humicola TaxID=2992126 RepID=UPI0022554946|nr:hypothetical protein [Dyella humicola]